VLFHLDFGSLVVSHCYISHSGTVFTGLFINTDNNTNSLIGTYPISFYNTHVCDYSSNDGPNQSPIETVVETPIYTPDISPIETPMMTLDETAIETPIQSPDESPIETVVETPINTPDISPIETPQSSFTFNPTIIESPDQTSVESLNQNNALIVIIGSMAIIGVLFGIVFMFSFYKFDSPSFSGNSHSDENKNEGKLSTSAV